MRQFVRFRKPYVSALAALAIAIGLAVGPLSAQSASAGGYNSIDYLLPSGANPWGTAFDSQGNVWIAVPGCDPNPDCTNPAPGRIEVFSPSTQTWAGNYQLPAGYGQPLFLAIDASGNVWFPMFHTNTLGMFNPSTKVFTQWTVPTPASGPWDIAIDHNGKIWFTEHYVNKIGEFDPVTATFTEIATPATNSQPYGITVDANNNIWFTENNPTVALIGEYTAAGQLQEYKIRNTLPGNRLTPHMITEDASGNIWWTEGWVGKIGELNVSGATPGTNNGVTEYSYPKLCTSCGTHTSGIGVDSGGNIWFDDSTQNLFGSYSPGTGTFTISAVPTNGGHPHDGLNVDSGDNVWFDEEFARKLAEAGAGVPSPPATTVGSVLAQDTYQRPDQKYWGVASDGHPWGGSAATNSSFAISNGTGVVTNPSSNRYAVLGGTVTDAQVMAIGSASAFSGSNYGVLLRYTNGSNWYRAYIDGSKLIIRRDVGGSAANLNSVNFAATPGTSYTIKFQATANWLQAKVWATGTTEPSAWMLTTQDGSLTSGSAGVSVYGGATFSFTAFAVNAVTATTGS